MSFFQSDIVQAEMKEIAELQEQIYMKVFEFASMTNEDKIEHVEMLEELHYCEYVVEDGCEKGSDAVGDCLDYL